MQRKLFNADKMGPIVLTKFKTSSEKKKEEKKKVKYKTECKAS